VIKYRYQKSERAKSITSFSVLRLVGEWASDIDVSMMVMGNKHLRTGAHRPENHAIVNSRHPVTRPGAAKRSMHRWSLIHQMVGHPLSTDEGNVNVPSPTDYTTQVGFFKPQSLGTPITKTG